VEIDNTAPENVMNMWGKKIKVKKQADSTLMSYRMIMNQADLVKERIARAKKLKDEGAEDGDDDEGSLEGIPHPDAPASMDNSAAALFGFGGSNKKQDNSVSMDNSAAALFGFAGGNKRQENSIAMDNSAAALFGFGGGDKRKDNSVSMDNSAAALFGFGGGNKRQENSVSMDNSAAALFGFGAGVTQKSFCC